MNETVLWIWLSLKFSNSNSEALKLLKEYDYDIEKIYKTTYAEFITKSRCSKALLKRLDDKDLSKASDINELCILNNVKVLACGDEEYPQRLMNLYNLPVVLYAKGNIEKLNEKLCVAVVGTRKMTNYGKHAAFDITRQLCGYGTVIVSGAAYGVDTIANKTALYFDSDTIAVLGCGINVAYPTENAEMLEEIGRKGLLISEYPPNTPPLRHNFPQRNRIISGLCDALLMVEGDTNSGALITAKDATEQGRYIYAVPGDIYSDMSEGTNILIRDGAKLCMRAEDIVEDFSDKFKITKLDRVISSEKYIRYDFKRNPDSIRTVKKPAKSVEKQIEKIVKAQNEKRNISENKAEETKISDERINEVLASLSESELEVLNTMPKETAINSDKITEKGFSASEVLVALTMLEMSGAVQSLPGGLFKRLF